MYSKICWIIWTHSIKAFKPTHPLKIGMPEVMLSWTLLSFICNVKSTKHGFFFTEVDVVKGTLSSSSSAWSPRWPIWASIYYLPSNLVSPHHKWRIFHRIFSIESSETLIKYFYLTTCRINWVRISSLRKILDFYRYFSVGFELGKKLFAIQKIQGKFCSGCGLIGVILEKKLSQKDQR